MAEYSLLGRRQVLTSAGHLHARCMQPGAANAIDVHSSALGRRSNKRLTYMSS